MDNEQAKQLGRRLHERRLKLGLSTRDLADRAQTTHTTVIRLERGAYEAPSPGKLTRIGRALGLSPADLFALISYSAPEELPTFRPYLRTKYRDLPRSAVLELERSFKKIARRHGIDPDGPALGEDEQPE